MADATSLPALKDKWKIPEKPLSQSFRCCDKIATTVRNVAGNYDFCGCSYVLDKGSHPIIVREATERFSCSILLFQDIIQRVGISETASAIICRAHTQLETIRGEVNYSDLKGLTKELAQASFFRDCRKDYKRAYEIVANTIQAMTEGSDLWARMDEFPESEATQLIKIAIWRFVKSQSGLPAVLYFRIIPIRKGTIFSE